MKVVEFAPGQTARTLPILLLSRRDAARMLGIGLTKFHELLAAGEIRPVRLLPDAAPQYRADEIQALVDRKTEK